MAYPHLVKTNGLRVAVEGCGHGVLHSIYASITKSCEELQWPDVDLVIIGGDFQAVRNADDFACVSIPAKYRDIQDFHEYYSGARRAPYLTIFVGGNHEASNYLFELYYGGWVAPNIYYMGATNVINVGGLRIAGMSGIWKGYDYNKPHHERLPYNQDDVKSVYHTREIDVRKLLNVRTQVDVGISHDWPRGVEWAGDWKTLFRKKDLFEADARNGTLGNVAARYVLDRLRPPYWFSAHLHVKFAAVIHHNAGPTEAHAAANGGPKTSVGDPKDGTGPCREVGPAPANVDEIDLDLEDEEEDSLAVQSKVPTGTNGAPEPVTEDTAEERNESVVAEEIRAQLPAAFSKTSRVKKEELPVPEDITNTTTDFLALDKCLPRRHFLQLLCVPVGNDPEIEIARPVRIQYDPEWLAITKVFASDLNVGDASAIVATDLGEAHYQPLIEEARAWMIDNVVSKVGLDVPENFEITAPTYDPARGLADVTMPDEYSNIQTKAFCELLQIPNPFDISQEERADRKRAGPAPMPQRDHGNGRGGGHGRGRGRGRRRGGLRGNRSDRGRGRSR